VKRFALITSAVPASIDEPVLRLEGARQSPTPRIPLALSPFVPAPAARHHCVADERNFTAAAPAFPMARRCR
jgi:hypothetical protein